MQETLSVEQRRRDAVPAYKRVIPRRWLRLAAIVLVTGTTVGSFLPGWIKMLIGTHPDNHLGVGHRLYHFGTFGLSAAALLLLAEDLREELRAAVFVVGLGCFIEVTQHVTGMSQVFEWWDLRDDFLAVGVVFLMVQVGNWRDGKRQKGVSEEPW